MMARALLLPAFLTLALLLSAAVAQAVEPSEMLKDPVLEARARAISQQIRCVVCQNQTIDDSNAELAHELRIVLRERLTAGDTDQQVKDFLTARYGDFVLLKPPFRAKTLALWIGPAMVFLIGGAIIALTLSRRRRATQPAPLSVAESRRLAQLTDPARSTDTK
jgi:cytochrome c-type biogenesis protein CcmH